MPPKHQKIRILHFQKEYLLFRRCAKYWRQFERLLRQDPTALRLLEVRHASCWLIHVEEDMRIVIKVLSTYLSREQY